MNDAILILLLLASGAGSCAISLAGAKSMTRYCFEMGRGRVLARRLQELS